MIEPCLTFCALSRGFITNFLNQGDYLITSSIENKQTDTQAIVGRYKYHNIIAFRSTEMKLADLFTNSLFFKAEIPYITMSQQSRVRVHSGFIRAYRSVRIKILNEVSNFTNGSRIIVTGHSLGGALAILCGLDIKYNNPDALVSVYTFGAPRVGNRAFIESYKEYVPDSHRYVIVSDLITRIPVIGYSHVHDPMRLKRIIPKHSLREYAKFFNMDTSQWR